MWAQPEGAQQFLPDHVLVVQNRNEVALERLRFAYGFSTALEPLRQQQLSSTPLPSAALEFLER
jgi:hypothetical protein